MEDLKKLTEQEQSELQYALDRWRQLRVAGDGDKKAPEIQASIDAIKAGGFKEFVKQSWHLVEPARPLVWNFQIEAVCDHLQAVSEGRIRKIVINIPPGTSKSTLVSVLWPCWEWTFRPFLRWMFASYNERLSLRDSVRRRDVVIASDWYQARWKEIFSVQKDNERYYTNSAQGGMYSTSTGGSVTGFRAERLVIDDPHDPKGAISDVQREGTEEWLKLTWPTRMNETKYSAMVVVMQRLHVDDASGLYLRMGGWDNLKVPMQYKGRRTVTSIGWSDPRTVIGSLIDERVFPLERVENDRRLLGPWGEAGQFDQEPTPIGGGIIKSSWLKTWKYDTSQPGYISVEVKGNHYSFDPRGAFKFCVADLAMTEKEIGPKKLNDPDWTVFMSWMAFATPQGSIALLMDVVRLRMEGPDSLPQLAAMHKRDRFALIGVENIANKMWYQVARRDPWRLPVREISNRVGDDVVYTVDKGKTSRAISASAMWADGRMFMPEFAPWLNELFLEMDNFPNYPHDDQVDCLVYGTVIAERYKGNPLTSPPEPEIKTERRHADDDKDGRNLLDRWDSPGGGLHDWGNPM